MQSLTLAVKKMVGRSVDKKDEIRAYIQARSKRPIVTKCSLSAKSVLYAIFFSGEGVAIKVPVKKDKSIA